MSVTRRFVGVLVMCSFVALVAPVPVSIAVAVLAAVVAVADATIARRPFLVSRSVTSVLSRGVSERLTLTIDGAQTGRGNGVSLRQPLPPDAELSVHEISGHHLESALTMLRRGRHLLPRPAIAVDGPLGLGRWMHRQGDESPVTVYPDMKTAWRIADAVRRGRFSDPGVRTRGPLGLGTDFESIREYRADDDIRLVNWKASSRLGTPMSNNLRIEQDRDLVCCIDSGRLMASPIGSATRLDVAFDAVVALALVADEVGDRIGSIAFADTIRRHIPPGRKTGRRVVEASVDLEPLLVDSNYEAAFHRVGSSKRSLVVVLTDLIEPAATQPLLDAVPVLVRRHVVVVASIDDPEISALSGGPAEIDATSIPLDVARSRLAGDLIKDRDSAAQALRHLGAVVVIAPPERFAEAVVHAYLRTKRLARL
jgi:uncharacterized protein (DUF58 family)